jgi:hypothetical protein
MSVNKVILIGNLGKDPEAGGSILVIKPFRLHFPPFET